MREALRGLEATGIVQLQQGVTGGAFIQNGDKAVVSRSISDIIVLGRIPLRQVMEVRSLLLARAVQLACEWAKAEDFDLIENNIRETEASSDDPEAESRCVLEFYTLIGALPGNEVLGMLIEATTSIVLDFAASHRSSSRPSSKYSGGTSSAA